MNEQDKEEFDVEAHKTRLEGDDLAEDVEGHKAGLIDDEDVEGHRHSLADGPDEDVEGHRYTAGLIEDDEDVEGHRHMQVQPPRDTDLGGTDR